MCTYTYYMYIKHKITHTLLTDTCIVYPVIIIRLIAKTTDINNKIVLRTISHTHHTKALKQILQVPTGLLVKNYQKIAE